MNKKWRFMGLILLVIAVVVSSSFFAFERIYENLREPKLTIALVNEDQGAMLHETNYQFGNVFVKQAERDTSYDWLVTTRGIAESRLKENKVDISVIIPSDFSQGAVAINEVTPEKLPLHYTINPMSDYLKVKSAELVLEELKNSLNKDMSKVYFSSLLSNLEDIKKNLVSMGEEDILHQTNLDNFLLDATKSTHEDMANVLSKTVTDTESLNGFGMSLDSSKNQHQTYLNNFEKYLESYDDFFEKREQQDEKLVSQTELMREALLNSQRNEHQKKISEIDTLITDLQHYLEDDLSYNLKQMIELNEEGEEALDKVKENLDDWLGTQNDDGSENKKSKLTTDIREIIEQAEKIEGSTLSIHTLMDEKIRDYCRSNITGTTDESMNMKKVCWRLFNMYDAEAKNEKRYQGQSTFVVDPNDIAEFSLVIKTEQTVFEEGNIQVEICTTPEQFVAKEQGNSPCTQLVGMHQFINNELGERPELRISPIQQSNETQYLKISYELKRITAVTVGENVQNFPSTIDVKQHMRTLISKTPKPTMNPILSGASSASGTSMPYATIHYKLNEEPNIGLCDNVDDCANKVQADANGNWVIGTLVDENENPFVVHADDRLMIVAVVDTKYDNGKEPLNGATFANVSDVAEKKVANNPSVETEAIFDGKSIIKGKNNLKEDQIIEIQFFENDGVTPKSNISSIQVATNTDGEWMIESPIELQVGNILKFKRRVKDLPDSAVSEVVVRDMLPLTVNNPIEHIEANQQAHIEGTGEPSARLTYEVIDEGGNKICSGPNEVDPVYVDAKGEWNFTLINASCLQHGYTLEITQKLFEKSNVVEKRIEDHIPPDVPVLLGGNQIDRIDEGDIKIFGTGEVNAIVYLEFRDGIEPDPIKYCTKVNEAGNWTLTQSTESADLGCLDASAFEMRQGDYLLYQMDKKPNKSNPDIMLSIRAGAPLPLKLYVQNVLDGDTFLTGTASPTSGFYTSYVSIKLPGTETFIETEVDSTGKWNIDLPEGMVFHEGTEYLISHFYKNDQMTEDPSEYKTKISVEAKPSEENNTEEIQKLLNPSVLESEDDRKYFSTVKDIEVLEVPIENVNPRLIEEYLLIYYGFTPTEILDETTEPKIIGLEDLRVNAREGSIYRLLLQQQDGDSNTSAAGLIIEKLESLEKNMRTSLENMRTLVAITHDNLKESTKLAQKELESLEGENGKIAQLKTMKTNLSIVQKNVESLQNDISKTSIGHQELVEISETETTFEVIVSEQHVDLVSAAINLYDQTDGLHEQMIVSAENSSSYEEVATQMMNNSGNFVTAMETESAAVTDSVSKSLLFTENVLNSYTNANINGVENTALTNFLSSPVTRENDSQVSGTAKSIFPYYLLLLTFIIALLIGYIFMNNRQPVQKLYEDEYLRDIAMYNLKQVVLLISLATVVGIITGLISGKMAQIESSSLLIWILFTTLLLNVFVQISYLLLSKLKNVGMFIILGFFSIYLVTNQALGVYVPRNTNMGKVLNLLPFQHLEKILLQALYGVRSGGMTKATIILTIVFVIMILINITSGMIAGKKEIMEGAFDA